MPGAALIATAMTTHAARPTALWIGGVDVIEDPAGRYGAPIDSIRVTEAGPGGVSKLTATVEDYASALAIQTAVPVLFMNLTTGVPIFAGVLKTFREVPDFGEQGRTWYVEATGVEAYLDWAVTTADVTFPTPGVQAIADIVLSVVAQSTGVGPLRAAISPGATFHGNQAGPVSIFGSMGATPLVSITIPAGTSLREAIRIIVASVFSNPSFDATGFAWTTVDFTYGLRVWTPTPGTPPPLEGPDDYGALTISNTAAGANVSESLEYVVDDALIAGVLVVGTGVSAYVPNTASTVGAVAYLPDTTLTTTAACQAAGSAYLAALKPALRGTYQRTDTAPVANVHAMSFVTITDARVGLAASNVMILGIEKTFQDSGREDWTISFGGLPPRASSLIRRLTRTARA